MARDIAGDIRLDPRIKAFLADDEFDAGRRHPLVRGVEVIDLEEKADAPGRLVSDRRRLALSVRLGEENAGVTAGRADDHPPLRPPVIGQRGRVLDQVKSESAGEERNGLVVVVNDDRNLVQSHARKRTPDPGIPVRPIFDNHL